MTFYTRFADTYETIFPFSDDVYRFLRRYLPDPPASVLDIGCGTGHYTARLAEDGFEAWGVDLDPAMIDYARAHYENASFEVRDMRDIAGLGGVFDAGICIGNTAAHLPAGDFEGFLTRLKGVLKPDGVWILQVMNWDYVLSQRRVVFPVLEADGAVFHRAYVDITEDRVTFVTRLILEGEMAFEDSVPLHPLRSHRIDGLHRAVGFERIVHVGSYSGAPFDPNTFSADIYVFRLEAHV
jgi:SAM-dependent methyltransferase